MSEKEIAIEFAKWCIRHETYPSSEKYDEWYKDMNKRYQRKENFIKLR